MSITAGEKPPNGIVLSTYAETSMKKTNAMESVAEAVINNFFANLNALRVIMPPAPLRAAINLCEMLKIIHVSSFLRDD